MIDENRGPGPGTLRSTRLGATVAAGLAAAVLGTVAHAQVLPGPADPGRVDERLQSPVRPTSRPPLELQSEDLAPPPAQAGIIKFDFTDLVIEGGTVYPPGTFADLGAELKGQEISLLQMYELRDVITTRYRGDGYILSQAVIPAQRIEGGVVRIEIVEGYVSDAEITGASDDVAADIRGYLARILAERPLRASTLERTMLLLDDLPGIGARSVFRPAEGQRGASILAVVVDRSWLSGSLSIDNRGSKSIGPIQADLSAQASTMRHQLSLRTLAARPASELRLGDLGYTYWIGEQGTSLTTGVRRSWSSPGGRAKPLDIASLTTSLRAGFSHPLMRSRSQSLRLTGDFTLRDSGTDLFDGQPTNQRLNQDSLRILSGGLSWDFADSWGGSNVLGATVARGLNVLNASKPGQPLRTRRDGEVEFWKLNLTAQRDMAVGEGLFLTLAAEAQLADRPLLSSEEYGVGGKTFGQGFDPSTITGDQGWAVRGELSTLLLTEGPGDLSLTGFGFGDLGATWNYNPTPRAGWQSLGSAGIGIRGSMLSAASGSLTLAKPLADGAENGRDWRLFFTFSLRY